MKKVFSLLVIAGMVAFVACGPSAEELAAKKKKTEDSLAEIARQDSIAAAELAQKEADSIEAARIADSIAQATAKGGKTTTAPKPKTTTTQQPLPKGKG